MNGRSSWSVKAVEISRYLLHSCPWDQNNFFLTRLLVRFAVKVANTETGLPIIVSNMYSSLIIRTSSVANLGGVIRDSCAIPLALRLFNVCAVVWRIFVTVEGYHQYCWWKKSVHWIWMVLGNVEGYYRYCGGIQFSTVEIFRSVKGYHQYIGWYSLLWRDTTVHWRVFSTVESIRYGGGCSVLWMIVRTFEDVRCCFFRVERTQYGLGYHQYCKVK